MIEKIEQYKAIGDGYNNVNKDYINEFVVVIIFVINIISMVLFKYKRLFHTDTII